MSYAFGRGTRSAPLRMVRVPAQLGVTLEAPGVVLQSIEHRGTSGPSWRVEVSRSLGRQVSTQ
jgi:hypothetical protein